MKANRTFELLRLWRARAAISCVRRCVPACYCPAWRSGCSPGASWARAGTSRGSRASGCGIEDFIYRRTAGALSVAKACAETRVLGCQLKSSRAARLSCKWCRSGWCRGKSGRGEGWLRVGRAKGDGAALAGRRRLRGDDCTHRGRASCGEGVCGVCGWSVAEAGEACGRRAWRRERGRGLGELCVRVPGTLATWPSGEGKG